MPTFSASQLIGKTFYTTKPLNFYRVSDINTLGDNAKPVSNKLKTGYSFVLDSFLLPTEPFTKYGIRYAKRSDTYFTFYGNDKNYYAVKYAKDNFSSKALKEQGAKTDEQIIKEKEQEQQTPADYIKNALISAGTLTKNVIYIGLGIFAIGYILPKILKK